MSSSRSRCSITYDSLPPMSRTLPGDRGFAVDTVGEGQRHVARIHRVDAVVTGHRAHQEQVVAVEVRLGIRRDDPAQSEQRIRQAAGADCRLGQHLVLAILIDGVHGRVRGDPLGVPVGVARPVHRGAGCHQEQRWTGGHRGFRGRRQQVLGASHVDSSGQRGIAIRRGRNDGGEVNDRLRAMGRDQIAHRLGIQQIDVGRNQLPGAFARVRPRRQRSCRSAGPWRRRFVPGRAGSARIAYRPDRTRR